MNCFIRNIGIILVLLGVVCLVVYKYAMPSNVLLVLSLVIEALGIVCYVTLNRRLE